MGKKSNCKFPKDCRFASEKFKIPFWVAKAFNGDVKKIKLFISSIENSPTPFTTKYLRSERACAEAMSRLDIYTEGVDPKVIRDFVADCFENRRKGTQ